MPVAAAIAWIAIQAFAATQVGLRVGARLSNAARERAEWLAGWMLLAVAAALVVLMLRPT